MKFFSSLSKIALAIATVHSGSAFASKVPALKVGVHCRNTNGFAITITPYDHSGRRVELAMINKRNGSIIDDNLAYITDIKTVGSFQVLLIQDPTDKSQIEIWGTNQSNLGRLRVIYKNPFIGISETFLNCDIVE